MIEDRTLRSRASLGAALAVLLLSSFASAGVAVGGPVAPAATPLAPSSLSSSVPPSPSSSSSPVAPSSFASAPGVAPAVTGSTAALPLPIRGVDRSGTEYACIQGWGYGDGPYDLTSVQAIRSWNVTAVRVPLNEDCWLDINVNGTVAAAWSGAGYRSFIVSYVDLLESQGIRPILDLHWNAPGTWQAFGQQPMADESHGPAFWSSVAYTFRNDSLVIFDLYNEPHDISWSCWLNGCFQTYTANASSTGWQTAGMQQLLDVVRSAGADTQLVMMGGLNWSNDLSGFLSHEPVDPAGPGHLAASLHMYQGNPCDTWSCWNTTLLPILHAGIPLITGELGESDCEAEFLYAYWAWADPLGVSYLGWTWDDWATCSGPVLIADYTGTPYDTYGTAFRDHLRNFSIAATSTPSVPLSVVASPGNGFVNVTWAAPASSGTWPENNYQVAWGTSVSSLTMNRSTGYPPVLYSNVTSLTNGQTYYFSVRAESAIGWGPWSTPVSATPQAVFSVTAAVSPLSGTAPLTVSYSGSPYSGSGPYTYAWAFGDGTRSTVSSGTHTYDSAGSYSVTLVCNDSVGGSASATAGPVVVGSPPLLIVTAAANTTAVPVGSPVTFSATSSGGSGSTTFAWRLGDGTTATGATVVHSYSAPGTYGAWVNATDSQGVVAESNVITIRVSGLQGALEVGASATPLSGTAPLTVAFTATPSGGDGVYSDFAWAFGDGETSSVQDPSHTYTSVGTYVASVVVTDGQGQVASSNSFSITVSGSSSGFPVIVEASANVTSGTAPLAVAFTATVSGGEAPYSYEWSFGNGATAPTNPADTTFSASGTYLVNLTVTDSEFHQGWAVLTIRVAPPSSCPCNSANGGNSWFSSSSLPYLLAGAAGVAVAFVAIGLYVRRRNRASGAMAAFPPPPPPYAGGYPPPPPPGR